MIFKREAFPKWDIFQDNISTNKNLGHFKAPNGIHMTQFKKGRRKSKHSPGPMGAWGLVWTTLLL